MRQQKKGRRGLGEKAKTGRRLLPFGAMGREPCGRCGFWAKRCAAKPFPGHAGSLGGKDRRRQKPPSKGEGGAVGFFVCAKGPKAAPAAPSPGSPPVSRPLAGPHTRLAAARVKGKLLDAAKIPGLAGVSAFYLQIKRPFDVIHAVGQYGVKQAGGVPRREPLFLCPEVMLQHANDICFKAHAREGSIFICQQGGHGSSPFLRFTCEVAAGCGGAGCQGQREPQLSPARVDARPARLLRRSSPAAPENGSRPGKSGAAFHGQGRCPAPCFRSV